MTAAKWTAVLAILFLVSVQFCIFTDTDGSDATDVPVVNIDDILDKETNYWVKATYVPDDGVYISNNGTKTDPCILEYSWNGAVIGSPDRRIDFVIPEGSGIKTDMNSIYIFNVNMTINGSYNVDNTMSNVSSSITVNSSFVGNTLTLYGSSSMTVKGNLEVGRINLDDGSTLTADGGSIESDDAYFNDNESRVNVKSYGHVEHMNVCDIFGIKLMDVENIRSMSNGGFGIVIIEYNSRYDVTLEGELNGSSPTSSHINIGNSSFDGKVGAVFDNVSFSYLTIDLTYLNGKLTIYSDDGRFDAVGNDSIFTVSDESSNSGLDIIDRIRSGKGELFVAMEYQILTSTGSTETYVYSAVYIESGVKEKCFIVTLSGMEGIDRIIVRGPTVGQGLNIVVRENQTFDLGTIMVKCSHGFSFDGWYYTDSAGKEVKITDPESFSASDNMTIYAKATPIDHQPDYTVHFVILSILIIVLIAAVLSLILYYRGIIW